MRVLVTGASGFIGAQVARALVERGHEVHAVVRPGHATERLSSLVGSIEVLEADLAEASEAARMAGSARPDAAVHAAWYVEPGKYLHAVDENLAAVGMTAGVFRALLDAGCTRIVNVGTGFEPGAGGGVAGGGVAGGKAGGKAGVQPPQTSIYASCKSAVHEMVGGLAAEGVSATCAQVFYLYGPGEDANRLVPALIRACLAGEPIDVTDGKQQRDYLHVADVAAGLCTLVEHPAPPSVDVCSGAPLEVRDLYDAVGEATGRRELIRDGARPYAEGEVVTAGGDDAPLRALGWAPAVSLRAGITECVAYWRSHIRPRS